MATVIKKTKRLCAYVLMVSAYSQTVRKIHVKIVTKCVIGMEIGNAPVLMVCRLPANKSQHRVLGMPILPNSMGFGTVSATMEDNIQTALAILARDTTVELVAFVNTTLKTTNPTAYARMGNCGLVARKYQHAGVGA